MNFPILRFMTCLRECSELTNTNRALGVWTRWEGIKNNHVARTIANDVVVFLTNHPNLIWMTDKIADAMMDYWYDKNNFYIDAEERILDLEIWYKNLEMKP